MKPLIRLFQAFVISVAVSWATVGFAGTWSDPFTESVLGADWQVDRDYFMLGEGNLRGVSAMPLPPVPLHRLEVGKGWTDYTVQCRLDVVEPNLLICTKGALILRDNGTDGYVFALHVATGTIEVYRLSDHEMLLSVDAPLELKTWYLVRAELRGPTMSFFVDDKLIGTLTDDRSLSGAVGVAVQDVMDARFADFRVTGPDVPGNGLELIVGQTTTLTWPAALTNYVLKVTSGLGPGAAWDAVTNAPTIVGGQASVTLEASPGCRFYLLAPKN